MRHATAAAFRQALEDRLKTEAAKTALSVARLRKRAAFALFLRRLAAVTPDRRVLKGALALDFRFHKTTRSTRDMDLSAGTKAQNDGVEPVDDEAGAVGRSVAIASDRALHHVLEIAIPRERIQLVGRVGAKLFALSGKLVAEFGAAVDQNDYVVYIQAREDVATASSAPRGELGGDHDRRRDRPDPGS
jgi:hypothetical protein